MSDELCQICKIEKFKYTCPKCNIIYCSVKCYKSNSHLNCSEQFYKNCIQEELAIQASTSKNTNDAHKILEILQRVSNDGTIDPNNFENLEEIDELDSDDEEEEIDLSKRLHQIDINDADKLWNVLTKEEKLQFESLIQNGDIIDIVPEFEPWWLKQIPNKMIKNLDYNEMDDLKELNYPEITTNILDFDKILKKSPHPAVKYNLNNILGSYSCTVRFFAGDHLSNALEATNYLWMICNVFSNNVNFDNDEEALKSIIYNGQNKNLRMDHDDYGIIFKDVNSILQGPFEKPTNDIYKLAALSDIQLMFSKAKIQKIKQYKNKDVNTFSKKFANIIISDELNKNKICQLIKKVDFFLSYVKSKKYIEIS